MSSDPELGSSTHMVDLAAWIASSPESRLLYSSPDPILRNFLHVFCHDYGKLITGDSHSLRHMGKVLHSRVVICKDATEVVLFHLSTIVVIAGSDVLQY